MKRYKGFFILLILNIFVIFIGYPQGVLTFEMTLLNIKEMLLVLPPIFILLGLMDVWVKREQVIQLMGDSSGILGMFLAFLLGSLAAGPLYAAFPIAVLMLQKGVSLKNMSIFLGSWSTLKIPLLLFELANLGLMFTLVRASINLFGIVILAHLLTLWLRREDKEELFNQLQQ